ncbi:MAG: AEC family transporter [Puniceicoccales bacterium]|jgi:predicted permease|nr:AEC family transporter [Puniceicoccales bacterium]
MTLGSFFALALNKGSVAPLMPEWRCSTFSMLGACAIPMGILLVGMSLPSLMAGFSWRSDWRVSVGSCVLRNGVIPVAMVVPVWLFSLPEPLGPILALQAAMSAGFFPIVVAQHFGGDARLALRVTIASSICAVVTLPLWLNLLSGLIYKG